MGNANIHDRQSIARLYPRDAFASDAAENDRTRTEILHGVRITSGPDAAGGFTFDRSTQQAGEMPEALFLAPFHRVTPEDRAAADPDPQEGYEAFLDDIIAAATQGFQAADSPGPGYDPATGRPGDPRLRGPRQ